MDYYTTHSLATAVTAIERGFKECESFIKHRLKDYPDSWKDGLLLGGMKWRFPKTSHNEALMEHRVGDLVTYEWNIQHGGVISRIVDDVLWIWSYCGGSNEAGTYELSDGMFAIRKRAAIIRLRNGESMPVWEYGGT